MTSIGVGAAAGSAPAADPVVERAPTNVEVPAITGAAKAGETLTATPGTWTEEPTGFTYRWERCYSTGACLTVKDSSEATYGVAGEDAENQIKVQVTASNAIGSTTATSAPVHVERSWHFGHAPPRTYVARWWASREQEPRSGESKWLRISVSSGMCAGEPPPYLSGIRVKELGRSSRLESPAAIITALVLVPAETIVVGSVHEGEVMPACAGLGLGLGKAVKLKRPSGRLFIYDGSSTPPRLVLRPEKAPH
jgi:hypothetical protein